MKTKIVNRNFVQIPASEGGSRRLFEISISHERQLFLLRFQILGAAVARHTVPLHDDHLMWLTEYSATHELMKDVFKVHFATTKINRLMQNIALSTDSKHELSSWGQKKLRVNFARAILWYKKGASSRCLVWKQMWRSRALKEDNLVLYHPHVYIAPHWVSLHAPT